MKQHRACYEKDREKKLSDKKNQKVLGKFRKKLEQRYRQHKNSREPRIWARSVKFASVHGAHQPMTLVEM